MALYQSREVVGIRPTPNAKRAGVSTIVRSILALPVALALNDQIEMVILPADHVPIDFWYDSDDLDTNGTPLIAFDIGLMSGTPGDAVSARTIGTEFFSADISPRTGVLARTTRSQSQRIFPQPFDRSIGIKVQAAAATTVAALTSLNVNRGFWLPSTVYALNDFFYLPNGIRAKCTTAGTSAAAFPTAYNSAAYNTTVTDGTAVFTIADPAVGVSMEFRPARSGF